MLLLLLYLLVIFFYYLLHINICIYSIIYLIESERLNNTVFNICSYASMIKNWEILKDGCSSFQSISCQVIRFKKMLTSL